MQNGQEGVSAFEPKSRQESLHNRHDRLIEIQPLNQTLQIRLAKTSALGKHHSEVSQPQTSICWKYITVQRCGVSKKKVSREAQVTIAMNVAKSRATFMVPITQ